jgi:hypothetical protein
MGLDTKIYWLTDRQSQCDFDFDLKEQASKQTVNLRSTEEYMRSAYGNLREIWRLCVRCSTVMLEVCDLVRLLKFLLQICCQETDNEN